MKQRPPAGSNLERLLAVMAALRDPDGGCPWDLEQDFASIAPYTIEEAYEVADAIDRGDMDDLRGELGDLLLQVVFHARMAEEEGLFGFDEVAGAIADKMVRRHPHVFAGGQGDGSPGQWEEIKRREREAAGDRDASALAGIARGLPEWQRAVKLQKRAARVGFDWPAPGPVVDKLHEEIAEVQAELAAPDRGSAAARARLEEEIGDLLFVACNLARHAEVDVGTALRRANGKFERRFRAMEKLAAGGGAPMRSLDLEAQETLWQRVKQAEKDSGPA
ncbi:nucleoside triphosphate pyrophosphohydrolase [Lysobacter sp. GX 14042]|uniref:nucleoside triphosphate pyrophosphohydrolase n=1 Tax=Lysobacter sp. GX 14042 TaxID=2907155 RepID=UPI001F3CDCBC|nr:nucleoside triphosphate pyrophosphohydrolase [Lysobacter sp. GX 14042]MCE7031103.1 nucleoside triphosphate pyrophosphohydrolase [Lysobacter sp. GX 14042]